MELPRASAVRFVNRNNARISSPVQAKRIHARGHVTDERGKRTNFDLSGGLLFIKPRYLYFDLRQLGQTVIRFGSNDTQYWLWIKPEIDTLWWGTYAALDGTASRRIPIPPDMLIESLGLDELPGSDAAADVVYRVDGDANQLLWTRRDSNGAIMLTKEIWLDRRPPHLIRRVLSRDADGRVVFDAALDDYRLIQGMDALAAHRIVLRWRDPDGRMDLRIGEWIARDNIRPTSGAFRRPPDKTSTVLVD
jgi:hypothetical protein